MLSNRTAEQIKEAKLEDILENPAKYGAPSFEEFKQNREKWVGRHDDQFAWIDKGSTILKRRIATQKYFVFGYSASSLEECERIAQAEGYSIAQLDVRPQLTQDSEGKLILNVFMEKKNALLA